MLLHGFEELLIWLFCGKPLQNSSLAFQTMALTFLWWSSHKDKVEIEFCDSVRSRSFLHKCSLENPEDIPNVTCHAYLQQTILSAFGSEFFIEKQNGKICLNWVQVKFLRVIFKFSEGSFFFFDFFFSILPPFSRGIAVSSDGSALSWASFSFFFLASFFFFSFFLEDASDFNLDAVNFSVILSFTSLETSDPSASKFQKLEQKKNFSSWLRKLTDKFQRSSGGDFPSLFSRDKKFEQNLFQKLVIAIFRF